VGNGHQSWISEQKQVCIVYQKKLTMSHNISKKQIYFYDVSFSIEIIDQNWLLGKCNGNRYL
jgi:hypothetical protein